MAATMGMTIIVETIIKTTFETSGAMDALIAWNREMIKTITIEWIEDRRRGRDDYFDNKGG